MARCLPAPLVQALSVAWPGGEILNGASAEASGGRAVGERWASGGRAVGERWASGERLGQGADCRVERILWCISAAKRGPGGWLPAPAQDGSRSLCEAAAAAPPGWPRVSSCADPGGA